MKNGHKESINMEMIKSQLSGSRDLLGRKTIAK